MKKLRTLSAIAAIALAVCHCAGATVLTGLLEGVPESVGVVTWGDGINDLSQQWSVRDLDMSGWFYGSQGGSNADVFVYSGLTDIRTVTDASVFSYSVSTVLAFETDYVFFRGQNGYYGAWRIDDVYPSGGSSLPYAYLDGQWYFQDDGTASFVPEPATLLLVGLGVLALVRRRRLPSYQ